VAAAEPAHALSAPADETELEVRPHAPRDAPTVYAGRERGEPAIEGVEHVRLSPHVDHRGSLTEVVNVTHPFWQEPVVHAYRISIRPGRIKGWGMHKLQADRYLVESGTVRIVLYDGRVDSPTFERYEVHSFDDITAGLLRIPPACGTRTRTPARPTCSSSTSQPGPSIPRIPTSTALIRTRARSPSTGPFATAETASYE
jgi:dTDP-4-dehydrorhamnose 3,5-epimerase